jgi:tRNA threonylcarbamoyladenosine biosynthesis protein TsaE
VKMKNEISTLDRCQSFATELSKTLKPRTILCLKGEMGAGKTQFTKYLVEAMGGSETTSPSFAIHNSYATGTLSVEHFDLFRLENADDLESTGFWDIFDELNSVVVIEWSDKLEEFNLRKGLPRSWKTVELVFELSKSARTVSVTPLP